MRVTDKKVRKLIMHPVVMCVILTACSLALAQQKSDPAKSSVTGHYEGTAKDKAEEVIDVAFDLTEKDGAMSGMIHSSHGDFSITGGTHQGDAVTLQFDAGESTGTISLKKAEDKLSGTWSAGEDGGPIDLKRATAQEAPKGKS